MNRSPSHAQLAGLHAPSVDAPVRARENVGTVVARGRMPPSVRPRYDGEPPLGPYGSSRTGSTSTRRARGTLLRTGSPDPVSPAVAPYNSFRSPHALAAVDGLCRRDRSSIHAALDQQRPDDAGRFIGQGHG